MRKVEKQDFVTYLKANPTAKGKELAKHFGISLCYANTIKSLCRHVLGIEAPKKPRLIEHFNTIDTLVKKNPNIKTRRIAEILGITNQYAYQLRYKYNRFVAEKDATNER